jgi:uncharacterized protein (TIGR02217 family)
LGWSVDTTTGLVTFSTAPTLGVEISAGFEFDVPVRFDTDHMAVTVETYRLHAWQQIPIVELRGLSCCEERGLQRRMRAMAVT